MNEVAVTGYGVVAPNGIGRAAFQEALMQGRSGIGRITRFDCTTFQVQLAGEVQTAALPPVPPAFAAAAAGDIKIAFAFLACAEALAQAGIRAFDNKTLLHLGTSLEAFDLETVIADGRADFAAVARRSLTGHGRPLQTPLDTAASLLSAHFGTPGQALTNCSACAAGSQAIGQAFRAVRHGRCELAVCGGFDSMINPLGVGGFQLLGALTTDNDRGASGCRPFDASRSGAVLGEGAAVLVLEPLAKVRAEGRPVLATIAGYGSSLDAFSLSAPDPAGDGAIRAMRTALQDANLAPAAIGHINAHGTGTRLNDEIEAAAIRAVFADCWERLPVSATKSVTGHLIAAAGAVEAVASIMALAAGQLPPNPWLQKTGKGCELNHVTVPGQPFTGEYVLSNSFGFGGQNAALVFRRA